MNKPHLATLSEREEIKQFHVSNHLATSVRNEKEREVQEKDLPNDFPALYSDEEFSKGKVWIARDEQTNELIGCISLYVCQEGEEHMGAISGFVQVSNRSDDDMALGKKAWIHMLSVHPERRGKGLGRTLLNVALDEAKSQHVDRVLLITLPEVMQPAIKLYESVGFELLERVQTTHYLVDTWQKKY